MIDLIGGIVILVGAIFSLVAGIGLFRLPDIYVRMHAATKAGTLGAGLILIAIAIDAHDLGVTARAVAGLLFLLLTAPVAAHLLGRAAYLSGAKQWSQTCLDELEGKYDADGRRLDGTPDADLGRGPIADKDEPGPTTSPR
ncbi:MAG: monovalent cation/H(+) antiporter subunit G [Alphaproteobacteria bacterium]|nr:monovalent cation/H(+) antiporter subunit G [Alphaproteobacteria bacterium]